MFSLRPVATASGSDRPALRDTEDTEVAQRRHPVNIKPVPIVE